MAKNGPMAKMVNFITVATRRHPKESTPTVRLSKFGLEVFLINFFRFLFLRLYLFIGTKQRFSPDFWPIRYNRGPLQLSPCQFSAQSGDSFGRKVMKTGSTRRFSPIHIHIVRVVCPTAEACGRFCRFCMLSCICMGLEHSSSP